MEALAGTVPAKASTPIFIIMYSVLITAFKEAATIGAAMDAFLTQMPPTAELIVICPDAETTAVVHQFKARDGRIRHIADPQQGKPAALNLGLQAAQHDIVILSDGDVLIADDALAPLLAPFADEQVGAVTCQPVSISPRNTMLGYWSRLLVYGAHQERLRRDKLGQFLLCSGYLFAYRRHLVPQVPEGALAE
ncbi:MAG: glycosyltransferase, partial [Chloroflexi bacterium]|nr:glycosyltransferase [Chloroflexota bacterium]